MGPISTTQQPEPMGSCVQGLGIPDVLPLWHQNPPSESIDGQHCLAFVKVTTSTNSLQSVLVRKDHCSQHGHYAQVYIFAPLTILRMPSITTSSRNTITQPEC